MIEVFLGNQRIGTIDAGDLDAIRQFLEELGDTTHFNPLTRRLHIDSPVAGRLIEVSLPAEPDEVHLSLSEKLKQLIVSGGGELSVTSRPATSRFADCTLYFDTDLPGVYWSLRRVSKSFHLAKYVSLSLERALSSKVYSFFELSLGFIKHTEPGVLVKICLPPASDASRAALGIYSGLMRYFDNGRDQDLANLKIPAPNLNEEVYEAEMSAVPSGPQHPPAPSNDDNSVLPSPSSSYRVPDESSASPNDDHSRPAEAPGPVQPYFSFRRAFLQPQPTVLTRPDSSGEKRKPGG